MNPLSIHIDHDVTRAQRPPTHHFAGATADAAAAERLWPRSWHAAPIVAHTPSDTLVPFTLHAHPLHVPLLLARDGDGRTRCLLNLCTHRGARLVDGACAAETIACAHHGRVFRRDGRLLSAPGFEGCRDFPTGSDDLTRIALGTWHQVRFVSPRPEIDFDGWIAPLLRATPDAGIDDLATLPIRTGTQDLDCHWTLCVEERLCRPLAQSRIDAHAVVMQGGEPADRWLCVYLFPTTFVTLGADGLCVERVEPLAPGLTRIVSESQVRRNPGFVGAPMLHADRCASIQSGLASGVTFRGRYAPATESGVHHFHRLLSEKLTGRGGLPAVIDL